MMIRREFERVAPHEVGISCASIERLLDRLESATEMHGLMIMRHGKVCAEGWWTPYAPGLRHGLQSLTKTYAATAVGIAYTEGLLKLEDRIIDIFPDEAPDDPSENLQKLNVRDVLCMGCGMDTMPRPSKDWIRDFLATPVNHPPGTTYMYNSMGSTLLGAIVRKRTGEGLHDYLTPRLFEKIGIDPDNLLWLCMPDGMEVGGGGLYATTENNLRLMKLYADGGVWDGERILAEEYVRKATTLQNESATEAKHNPQATDNFVGYGFQIWMCKPEGVYRADGAMGQFSIVCPKLDMILSINETAADAHWAQNTLDVVWTFLDEVAAGRAVEGDEEQTARLSKRMAMLSLPAPVYAPYSPTVPVINKKEFIMESGVLGFEDAIGAMMSGTKPSEGIKRFSFDFEYDCCNLEFVQDDQTYCVSIATDGTRRQNIVKLESSPTTKLLLNGAWTDTDTFSVTARWIETCFEKRIDFTFSGDMVRIKKENTTGGFGPFGRGEEAPIAAKMVR
jgi:hypothetical protein